MQKYNILILSNPNDRYRLTKEEYQDKNIAATLKGNYLTGSSMVLGNEKIDVIRQLAMQYADAFIPLDGMFVEANVNGIPNVELSPDGVHPDTAGKKLIADALAPVVCKLIEEIK